MVICWAMLHWESAWRFEETCQMYSAKEIRNPILRLGLKGMKRKTPGKIWSDATNLENHLKKSHGLSFGGMCCLRQNQCQRESPMFAERSLIK